MLRSLFSALGKLFRFLMTLLLIAGLLLLAFIGYKGAQPMQIDGANGMTYWQFMRERIDTIREMPTKCQQLHFTGYLIAVPVYPALYTYVGLFPESILARHTQPDPAIPNGIHFADVPDTWWSLVEPVSWDAWVIPHLPNVLPECNLRAPQVTEGSDNLD